MLFTYAQQDIAIISENISDSLSSEIIIGTFRGNEKRNFYGHGNPSRLDVIWKFDLGEGKTVISRKLGERIWAGAGWTGQPLLVREGNDTFIIQGANDHHLRKINASSGEEIWRYLFDDVVKGTGTLWINNKADIHANSMIIFQGSRLGTGNYLDSKHIPSFRAISFFTGKELWRLDVKWTDSYSRDADGSGLVIEDTLYMALENSLLTVIDPDPASAVITDSMLQPFIISETKLYTDEDVIAHKNNVVTEGSPARLGNHIYIASGAGHVYGFNLITKEIDWDFFIGSDLDGSVVVTSDDCLLISVEKQYIKGMGGLFKIDPKKQPEHAVVWYYATCDTLYAGWEGGIIGTAAVNDLYIENEKRKLAAFSALDGFTYVVDHQALDTTKINPGPDGIKQYPMPVLIAKLETGPSVSSPVLTGNRLIVPGYNGLYLYDYNENKEFILLDKFSAPFEASPIIREDKIFIASRDGFLYCFGEKIDND